MLDDMPRYKIQNHHSYDGSKAIRVWCGRLYFSFTYIKEKH